MDDKIKSKIRKLLALGGSENDHESRLAIAKAQELLAEYKLNESDILDKEEKKCITVKTTISFSKNSSDTYILELADMIAENFCCVSYTLRYYGKKKRSICFMGVESDVLIAEDALHTANNAIIRGYNRVYKNLMDMEQVDYIPAYIFNKYKTGYVAGYIDGLKTLFEEQKEKHQEWGLVLIVPEEAQEFKSGLTVNEFSAKKNMEKSDLFYEEGYNDGKNFNMNKKIENGATALLR